MITNDQAKEIQAQVDEYLKFGPEYVAVALSISHKLPQWTADLLADRAERIEHERILEKLLEQAADIISFHLTEDDSPQDEWEIVSEIEAALQRDDNDG